MGISKAQLNPKNYPLDLQQGINLNLLLQAMEALEYAFCDEGNDPLIITSGVRSKEEQMRINPKAPDSAHVKAAACDVYDPEGIFYDFCMNNMELLEENEIYVEARAYTPTHTHLQIVPPISGRRIFLP